MWRLSPAWPKVKIINQRRDLEDAERQTLGNILFPGSRKVSSLVPAVSADDLPPASPALYSFYSALDCFFGAFYFFLGVTSSDQLR